LLSTLVASQFESSSLAPTNKPVLEHGLFMMERGRGVLCIACNNIYVHIPIILGLWVWLVFQGWELEYCSTFSGLA
jgi:hypothetical protein